MSFRLGVAVEREEGDEELFEKASSVSGGESDADEGDHFPDGGGARGDGGGARGDGGGARGDGGCDDQDRQRTFVPQPLRRMNSDSIYNMTSMMSQLPAKKGLSRHYEGKSQSFACMSEVRCLEDLRKKDNPYKQKIKSCKSYVALGGMMPKKPSSGSCANLSLVTGGGFRTPQIQNGYHQ